MAEQWCVLMNAVVKGCIEMATNERDADAPVPEDEAVEVRPCVVCFLSSTELK